MEVELKYSISDPQTALRIWDGILRGFSIVEGSQRETAMKAVYFDTEDGRLGRERIAVRVRREGETAVATVKWDEPQQEASPAQPMGAARLTDRVQPAGAAQHAARPTDGATCARAGAGPAAALHVHQEYNREDVPEAWLMHPPADLFSQTAIGARIEALLWQEPEAQLIPLLTTEFLRRSALLRWKKPDSQDLPKEAQGGGLHEEAQACGELLCEAAVDTGAIVAGGRSEPICELELELKQGDASALLSLGEQIARQYGLVPGTKSKFQRGRELLDRKE